MRRLRTRYVFCISNEDYPASLETRKTYLRLPDSDAAKHGLVRVVDESGEDYLYPERYFVSIAVPRAIASARARISPRSDSPTTSKWRRVSAAEPWMLPST